MDRWATSLFPLIQNHVYMYTIPTPFCKLPPFVKGEAGRYSSDEGNQNCANAVFMPDLEKYRTRVLVGKARIFANVTRI